MIGFLAAVLVLAQLCDDEGLFRACGAWMARTAAGRPQRLLAAVFVVAVGDHRGAEPGRHRRAAHPGGVRHRRPAGARPKPHVYACTHLSNTASLLLPVSNLTNLLAFAASGLTFTRFAALMALPWLAAIAVEYVVFRRFFATDLDAGAAGPAGRGAGAGMPVFALAVVACTLAGFVVTSALGVNPAWAALGRCALVLAARALARRRTTPVGHRARRRRAVPRLRARARHRGRARSSTTGSARRWRHLIPRRHRPARPARPSPGWPRCWPTSSTTCPPSWCCCRWPPPAGPGAVLAVLIGVNIGPNLTYAGSLATLLWRRDRCASTTPASTSASSPGSACSPCPPRWSLAVWPVGLAARHRRLTPVTVIAWIVEGTWPACVDAARARAADADHPAARHRRRGPRRRARRLRRPARPRPPRPRPRRPRWRTWPPPTPRQLLDAAAERLGRPVHPARADRARRAEVVAAAESADLLILARDGDRARLGPRSLGPATRFVVDHAPCPVLLVWPDPAPGIGSIPPRRPTRRTAGNWRPQRGTLHNPHLAPRDSLQESTAVHGV